MGAVQANMVISFNTALYCYKTLDPGDFSVQFINSCVNLVWLLLFNFSERTCSDLAQTQGNYANDIH